jgi:cytosine/adenosine deaminase-related metal-dependent hydrolase
MAIDSYPSSILLCGGVVLTHGTNDYVIPLEADLLIKDGVIAEIKPHIQVSADAKVIDCADMILCPGFIDTHHHLWQSLLKGRHANELLLDYMYAGMRLSNYCVWLH